MSTDATALTCLLQVSPVAFIAVGTSATASISSEITDQPITTLKSGGGMHKLMVT